MENWTNLYKEMAAIMLADLTDEEKEHYNWLNTIINEDGKSPIRWIDLWHNQVNFLEEEREFPTPSVFFSYRTKDVNDMGEKVQQMTLQIDCYLFYETFDDTFVGSYNQGDALKFIGLMDFINGRLHGTSGENFASMRKTGFAPEDTGNAGNLYKIVFECVVHDESAAKIGGEGAFTGVDVESDNTSFQIG